jgi:hypothetical protein
MADEIRYRQVQVYLLLWPATGSRGEGLNKNPFEPPPQRPCDRSFRNSYGLAQSGSQQQAAICRGVVGFTSPGRDRVLSTAHSSQLHVHHDRPG